MYNSELISPNGESIRIPYYEIGNYLENVVNHFVNENSDNKDLFEIFRQEYSYCLPYFDFAIACLGYKMKNPLITKESILYAKDGKITHENINSTLKPTVYNRMTDLNYNIEKANVELLTDCIISPNGIKYEVDRNRNFHHQDIYEILLIETMIYNKNLYEDFLNCMTNKEYQDIYYDINPYFRGRLGFSQVVVFENKSGFIIYNNDLKDEKLTNFLSNVKSFYPEIDIENNVEYLSPYFNEDEIRKAIEIKQEIGEMYESRRIRL